VGSVALTSAGFVLQARAHARAVGGVCACALVCSCFVSGGWWWWWGGQQYQGLLVCFSWRLGERCVSPRSSGWYIAKVQALAQVWCFLARGKLCSVVFLLPLH
jgi:hypothetical protein